MEKESKNMKVTINNFKEAKEILTHEPFNFTVGGNTNLENGNIIYVQENPNDTPKRYELPHEFEFEFETEHELELIYVESVDESIVRKESLGLLGERTNLKDTRGNELKTGDVVVISTDGSIDLSVVVENNEFFGWGTEYEFYPDTIRKVMDSCEIAAPGQRIIMDNHYSNGKMYSNYVEVVER